MAPLVPAAGLLRPVMQAQRFADTLVTRQSITVGAELGHNVGDPRTLTTGLLSVDGSATEPADEIVAARPLPPVPVRPTGQTWPARPDASPTALLGPTDASPDLPSAQSLRAAAPLDVTSGGVAAHLLTETPSATGRPSVRTPRLGPPRDGSALQRQLTTDPGVPTAPDGTGPSTSPSAGLSGSRSAGPNAGAGGPQDEAAWDPAVSVQTDKSTEVIGPLSSTAASARMGLGFGLETTSAPSDSAGPASTARDSVVTRGVPNSATERGTLAAAALPENGSAVGRTLAVGSTGGVGADGTAALDDAVGEVGSPAVGWAGPGRIEPLPVEMPADRPVWTDSGAEPGSSTGGRQHHPSADVHLQRDSAGAGQHRAASGTGRATSSESPRDRPRAAGPNVRLPGSPTGLDIGALATAAGAARPVPAAPMALLGARPIQTRLVGSAGRPSADSSSKPAGAGHDVISLRDNHNGHDSAARHDNGAGTDGGVGLWPDFNEGGAAAASVQRWPGPSAADGGRGAADTADPGAAALAAGVAERDGDGVRFRWADPYDEEVPVVQRATGQPPMVARAPAAPADPASSGGASTPPAGGGGPAMTAGGLDELAGQLYDRIRDRLGDELRRDRERAGLATGLH
ncbi:hypothetical protein [Hamadaea tsunoensis]|uniref:hypothetical protein n=1 Tax=Hamadaea tsunoensis TaxID=53368 RepID=UPI0012F95183|nr:hypothetical protein [Hamadaea tsunoensis]